MLARVWGNRTFDGLTATFTELKPLISGIFCCLLAWISGPTVDSWKSCGQILKEYFNIDTHFRTCLNKLDFKLLSFGLALLCANLPLFCVINFVSNQKDNQVFASDLSCLVDPARNILKTGPRCNIIANYGNAGVVNVTRDQTSESLLSRRVPQLKSHHLVVYVDCLCQEVDANCRLSISLGYSGWGGALTIYLTSKLSWVKRRIRLVFPTP